jgi:hypothetical protein
MFTKTPYEEINRSHDFTLWLGQSETITTPTVTVKDGSGAAQPTMIANVSQSGKQVLYTIKGGTSGTAYTVDIQILTSAGQKFEDVVSLGVK